MADVVDVIVQVARNLPDRKRRRLVNELLKSPEFCAEERLRLSVGEPGLSKKEHALLTKLIQRQRRAGKITRYMSADEAKRHTERLIQHAG